MTQTIAKYLVVGRKVVWTLVLTLTMMVGLSFVPIAGSSRAHAVSCHVVTNPAEVYRFPEGEDGVVGVTNPRTVPSSSGCLDINLRDIYWLGPTRTGEPKTCGYFRVRFYPSSGGSYVNSWHHVCSAGSSGPVVPIATDVLNGTEYRVEYWVNADNGLLAPVPAYHYQLID